ncbi:MAG TPA: phage holin family protein [Patescibacteria group bacterium]|jgi:putative membrane protein
MDWTRIAYGFAANLLGIFVAAMFGLVDYGTSFLTLAFAALAFGIINVLIRPVITVLSLPAILLTLGLFVFVVNAFMLWLTSVVVPGFETLGFWHTVAAAIVVGAVNFVLHALLKDITSDHLEKARKGIKA